MESPGAVLLQDRELQGCEPQARFVVQPWFLIPEQGDEGTPFDGSWHPGTPPQSLALPSRVKRFAGVEPVLWTHQAR